MHIGPLIIAPLPGRVNHIYMNINAVDPLAERIDSFNVPPSLSVLLEPEFLRCCEQVYPLPLLAKCEVLPHCSLVKG